MEAEGQNSPADILLTVDTSRLERAKGMGLLQSVESPVLEQRLPGYVQDDDNQWFGSPSALASSSMTRRKLLSRRGPIRIWQIRNTKA
jgi:ABC-type Fe3+ transport system substrate-binding protein